MAFVLAAGNDAKRAFAALTTPKINTEPQLIPEPEPETATEAREPRLAPTEAPLAPPGGSQGRNRAVRHPERL